MQTNSSLLSPTPLTYAWGTSEFAAAADELEREAAELNRQAARLKASLPAGLVAKLLPGDETESPVLGRSVSFVDEQHQGVSCANQQHQGTPHLSEAPARSECAADASAGLAPSLDTLVSLDGEAGRTPHYVRARPSALNLDNQSSTSDANKCSETTSDEQCGRRIAVASSREHTDHEGTSCCSPPTGMRRDNQQEATPSCSPPKARGGLASPAQWQPSSPSLPTSPSQLSPRALGSQNSPCRTSPCQTSTAASRKWRVNGSPDWQRDEPAVTLAEQSVQAFLEFRGDPYAAVTSIVMDEFELGRALQAAVRSTDRVALQELLWPVEYRMAPPTRPTARAGCVRA